MKFRNLLSVVLAVSLVFGLASSANATTGFTPAKGLEAAQRLSRLGLVRGRSPGDFALNDRITRAELVTLFIRALGREDDAKALAGASAFRDTVDHPWASGYVAVARQIGLADGYPDHTFRPDATVTFAEAVAFLVKLIGLAVDGRLGWPHAYTAAALNAGMIVPDDNVTTYAQTPIPRGVLFYFADNAMARVILPASGMSFYRTYVDTQPPALTVQAPVATTDASVLFLTGRVTGQSSLLAGRESALRTVRTASDGAFSVSVPLELGENVVLLSAVDLVGNETRREFVVTRTVGAPALIFAQSSLVVTAGGEAEVQVRVTDASENPIPDAVVTGSSELGVFADGRFLASSTPGKGSLTLRSGNAVALVAVTVTPGTIHSVGLVPAVAGRGEQVHMTAYDARGNEIPAAVFSLDNPYAVVDGNVFVASRPGVYHVQARDERGSLSFEVGVHSGVARSLVVTRPGYVVANNVSEYVLTLQAVDENGVPVTSADFSNIILPSEPGVTLSLGGPASNGTQSVTARFDTAPAGRAVLLEFTLDGAVGLTQVPVHAQIASAVRLEPIDSYIAANNGTERLKVVALVLDQEGEQMLTGSWELEAIMTGAALLDDGAGGKVSTRVVTTAGQQAEIMVASVQGQTGEATLTVSGPDLEADSATLTAAIAGLPVSVSATADKSKVSVRDDSGTGEQIRVVLRLVDVEGVTVTPEQATPISVQANIGQLTQLWVDDTPVSTLPDGVVATLSALQPVAEVKIYASVARTVTFTWKADGLSSALTTLTFSPGPRAKVEVKNAGTVSQPLWLPAANPTTQFAVQLVDRFGNPTAEGGIELRVTGKDQGGSPSSAVLIDKSATSAVIKTGDAGSATFSLTTLPYVGQLYTFEITGKDAMGNPLDNSGAVGWVTVKNSTPTAIKVTPLVSGTVFTPSQSQAGTQIDLHVRIEDAFERPFGISELDSDYLILYHNGAAVSVTWVEDNGAFKAPSLQLTRAGVNTFVVEVQTSSTPVQGQASVQVRPGSGISYNITQATRTESFDAIYRVATLKERTISALTIIAVDQFNNAKSLSSSRQLRFEVHKWSGTAWVAPGPDDVLEIRQVPGGSNRVGNGFWLPITQTATVHAIGTPGTYRLRMTDNAADPVTASVVIRID